MKLATLVIALAAGCGSSSEPRSDKPEDDPSTGKDAGAPRSIALCDEAAEDLASIELGNYAEPEVRAPAVERYKQRCRDEPLTRDELACLGKAMKKRWQAFDCAPRMFTGRLAKADCGDVMKHLVELAEASDNPRERTRAPEMIEAMRASCTEDEWPPAARRCLLMAGSITGLNACMRELPPDIERKRRERLNKRTR